MQRTLSTALISATVLFAPACKSEDPKTDEAAKSGDAKDGDAKDGDAKDGDAKDGEAKDGEAKAPEAPKPVAAAGGSDALSLVPDSAFMAGTMDLGMLAAMPSFNAGLVASMIQEPEARDAFETFRSCGLELNMLRRVSFAGAEEGNKGMAIVDGQGISKRSVLDCLSKQAKDKDGTVVTLTDASGYVVATSDRDDTVVFAIGDDRLVMTQKTWRDEIEARVKGEGVGAVGGSLKAVMPLADTTKKLWFVMGPSGDLSRELKGQPLETMIGASVWIDGLWDAQSAKTFEMGVKIGMPDDASATKGQSFLATQYEQVKPMAGMIGLPPDIVNKVKFGADGPAVTINLSLNDADLKTLEKVAAQMGGAAGGGMPGGKPPGM